METWQHVPPHLPQAWHPSLKRLSNKLKWEKGGRRLKHPSLNPADMKTDVFVPACVLTAHLLEAWERVTNHLVNDRNNYQVTSMTAHAPFVNFDPFWLTSVQPASLNAFRASVWHHRERESNYSITPAAAQFWHLRAMTRSHHLA